MVYGARPWPVTHGTSKYGVAISAGYVGGVDAVGEALQIGVIVLIVIALVASVVFVTREDYEHMHR